MHHLENLLREIQKPSVKCSQIELVRQFPVCDIVVMGPCYRPSLDMGFGYISIVVGVYTLVCEFPEFEHVRLNIDLFEKRKGSQEAVRLCSGKHCSKFGESHTPKSGCKSFCDKRPEVTQTCREDWRIDSHVDFQPRYEFVGDTDQFGLFGRGVMICARLVVVRKSVRKAQTNGQFGDESRRSQIKSSARIGPTRFGAVDVVEKGQWVFAGRSRQLGVVSLTQLSMSLHDCVA